MLVDGRDISRIPPHARNIGMVFQSYALWPHMSVYDNVAFGLVERRVARGETKHRVGEALSLVGLTDYARRWPNQLSGGQQQRVALARTIVIEPQVLLLDEPLSNLDKKLREQMRLELKRLQRTLGITTIFVTHDQEEAMTTADRMAVLDAGVLQQIGRPRELFDTPSNRFVAEFVGSTNLIAGHYDATRSVFVTEGLGDIPLTAGTEGNALSIRPHVLTIAAQRGARGIWFDGEVQESEFLGEFTRYQVRVGQALLTADAPHLSATPISPEAIACRLRSILRKCEYWRNSSAGFSGWLCICIHTYSRRKPALEQGFQEDRYFSYQDQRFRLSVKAA